MERSAAIRYKTGWLARLFAAHADYKGFTTHGDRIIITGEKQAIPFLSIGSGIAVERGLFWNSLAIHLEDERIIRLGGITKKQAGPLQSALNHSAHQFIRGFYQRLSPDIQYVAQQAQRLLQGKRYIRYPTAQQWLDTYQHLSTGLKRQDVHQYIAADVLSSLQLIQPILTQGHAYFEKLNEAYVQQQL